MRGHGKWCLGLVVIVGVLTAAEPPKKSEAPEKLPQEIWNTIYLDGNKSGFVHAQFSQITRADKKIIRSTMELSLNVLRNGEPINLRMITGTDETSDGAVTGVSMRQFLAKQQTLSLSGAVEDGQLHVKVEGSQRADKMVRWNDQVLGLYRQEFLFRDRQIKPADEFDYLAFEPQINAVLKTHVSVKNAENVDVLGVKKRLLRVEAVPAKIAKIQLPTLYSWVDCDFVVVRSQFEMQPFGTLTLIRSTREAATGQSGVMARKDIGKAQLIPLNRRVERPYDTKSAVYRITIKGDEKDPGSTFAQDDRQTIKNLRGSTFELHVRGNPKVPPGKNDEKVSEDYLKSSYFINWEDAKVKQLAKKAVGRETDSWKKAQLIEQWVHANMVNKNYSEAFATSDHVARTLEGDCTEHAVLAAAMCRAVGVPSRTAVGLLYVTDRAKGPVMGFHMWAEVFVHGQWMDIDGVFGQGYVGATHLKIADHSWADIQSLEPLLPVYRVIGKTTIEVVRVNGEE